MPDCHSRDTPFLSHCHDAGMALIDIFAIIFAAPRQILRCRHFRHAIDFDCRRATAGLMLALRR